MKQIETKELAQLLKDSYTLECLEIAGVDNWEGYDYSLNEGDYNSFCKQSDEEITKGYESADALQLFSKLPRLYLDADDKISITEKYDFCYIPTLYYHDDMYTVDWTESSDYDSIHCESGDSPEEAIQKAYEWCLTNGYIND